MKNSVSGRKKDGGAVAVKGLLSQEGNRSTRSYGLKMSFGKKKTCDKEKKFQLKVLSHTSFLKSRLKLEEYKPLGLQFKTDHHNKHLGRNFS